jgi:hypothetical protein
MPLKLSYPRLEVKAWREPSRGGKSGEGEGEEAAATVYLSASIFPLDESSALYFLFRVPGFDDN